jgi:hypothetical protein
MREFLPLAAGDGSVPPVPTFSSPSGEERVAVWEHARLKALGFSPTQSETLLAAHRSWHEASDLLAAGCATDLACLILAWGRGEFLAVARRRNPWT